MDCTWKSFWDGHAALFISVLRSRNLLHLCYGRVNYTPHAMTGATFVHVSKTFPASINTGFTIEKSTAMCTRYDFVLWIMKVENRSVRKPHYLLCDAGALKPIPKHAACTIVPCELNHQHVTCDGLQGIGAELELLHQRFNWIQLYKKFIDVGRSGIQ